MQVNNQPQKGDDTLGTFLAALQDGMIMLDANQDIVQINPAARKIFALGDHHWSGRPLADVIEQPELAKLIALLDETSLQSSRLNIPVGEDALYSAAAVRLDGGGFAISFHDVSDWSRLERISRDFVSVVSHDLRSPLTSILGYAELIERVGPVNDQQHAFIQRVQTSAANMGRLLEDLVRLGQFVAGQNASRERVDLLEILEEAIKSLSYKFAKKNLTLEVGFGGSQPVILANRGQMVHVFICLLDNAIKFSSPESTVQVVGRTVEQQVTVEVSDTGIGIPDTEIEHIFDRFFRGSNISENEPGNGLGLAIVKTVMDHLEGRIEVDSSLDSGTRIKIVLPAAAP